MKIFLDTSYFVELIDIVSPNVVENFLFNLIKNSNNFQLYYSTITLFELEALGGKLITKNEIALNPVLKGIQALIFYEPLSQITFEASLIMQLSLELRFLHQDFIDCMILASAIITADILITEDLILKDLMISIPGQSILKRYNADNFKIMTSKNFETFILKNTDMMKS